MAGSSSFMQFISRLEEVVVARRRLDRYRCPSGLTEILAVKRNKKKMKKLLLLSVIKEIFGFLKLELAVLDTVLPKHIHTLTSAHHLWRIIQRILIARYRERAPPLVLRTSREQVENPIRNSDIFLRLTSPNMRTNFMAEKGATKRWKLYTGRRWPNQCTP